MTPLDGSRLRGLTVHGWPIEYLDEHDPVVHDVQDQHAFQRQERYAPMARAIRLPLRVISGTDALAEVVAAVAPADQTNIPHADGQLRFVFLLQKDRQFGDEVGEDVAN